MVRIKSAKPRRGGYEFSAVGTDERGGYFSAGGLVRGMLMNVPESPPRCVKPVEMTEG